MGTNQSTRGGGVGMPCCNAFIGGNQQGAEVDVKEMKRTRTMSIRQIQSKPFDPEENYEANQLEKEAMIKKLHGRRAHSVHNSVDLPS